MAPPSAVRRSCRLQQTRKQANFFSSTCHKHSMSQPVVLIVFYSRCGSTEKLALAAAVGAVQGRALIRLRRMPDANAAKTLEQFSDCAETLLRMRREYIAPTEADLLGAD